jgi:membrane protein implicated in regulation of membrane protease activity
MSTIYSKKEIIRANVAFIYLILAIFQLVVLSIISNTSLRGEVIWLIPISLVSYIFTSKFISSKVNDKKYTFILNVMVLVYGVLAVIK